MRQAKIAGLPNHRSAEIAGRKHYLSTNYTDYTKEL
jgi:hypothetical protein